MVHDVQLWWNFQNITTIHSGNHSNNPVANPVANLVANTAANTVANTVANESANTVHYVKVDQRKVICHFFTP